MKLLLHACCGPCSLEPVRHLQEAGHEITIAYMNSNIHPAHEYKLRRDTLLDWAHEQQLPVVEGVYSPEHWELTIAELDNNASREDRCRACYRLRFEEVSSYAKNQGFDGICTTLSVSPYQYIDLIHEELKAQAESTGISYIFEDFRPFYQEATRRSRELGMYRQNYCGCRFSAVEAAQEREERKRARKAEKERRSMLKQKQLNASTKTKKDLDCENQ